MGKAIWTSSATTGRMVTLKSPFHAETRRILAYLRDLIEDSDLRHRDVEKLAGWSEGYLSQLLGGHIELRLRHLEVLTEALEIDPARFFRQMFPRQQPDRALAPGPRKPPGSPLKADSPLKVTPAVAEVYGFAVETLRNLHFRIDNCEKAIATAARQVTAERRLKDLG